MELVLVLVGIAGVFYIVGPVFIYFTVKNPIEPPVRLVDITTDPIGEKVKLFLVTERAHLEKLGFQFIAHIAMDRINTKVSIFTSLYYNPLAHDSVAALVSFLHQGDQMQLFSSSLEFSTRFKDGRVVDTNNNYDPNIFSFPHKRVEWFPGIKNAQDLLSIHRQILKEYRGAEVQPRDLSDPTGYLKAGFQKEYADCVQAGYMRPTGGGKYYGLTLGTAFLSTWQILWPWKAVVKSRQARKANELLKSAREQGAPGPVVLGDLPQESYIKGSFWGGWAFLFDFMLLFSVYLWIRHPKPANEDELMFRISLATIGFVGGLIYRNRRKPKK